MLKEKIDKLSTLPYVVVSGIFLLLSFILMLGKIKLVFNPVWVTIFISGIPMFYYALRNIVVNKKITVSLLISIAIISSIFIGEYFASGEIAFIMALGELLEDYTIKRTNKGINKLISILPQKARVLRDNNEYSVDLEDVKINDIVRIKEAETIPFDGTIIKGSTQIDESTINGESLPKDKFEGDIVYSGTTNGLYVIDIKVDKLTKDSLLQKMIDLVQEAEKNKAPIARIIDKWASYLVPIALLLAISAYFVTNDIIRAVTILVVFCPCALALATPTSIAAAIGLGTKNGIIIKSGTALEQMGKINIAAFDKTKTLTLGRLGVSDIILFDNNINNDYFLKYVASVEKLSNHPIGLSIYNYALNKNVNVYNDVENFESILGRGIKAKINGDWVLCGNVEFMNENNININQSIKDEVTKNTNDGKIVVICAINNFVMGIIVLNDIVKPQAANVINYLKNNNTDVVLLTGDSQKTSDYFAKMLNIDKVYANLLPNNKVDIIKKYQKENKTVLMTGDGINDAASLKTANVSISFANFGSDIAVDAASIILLNDNLENIIYLKKLSRLTVNTIKFNITLSMVINFVAIFLSLYGILTPVTGALWHNASSLIVVLNASMLYNKKISLK